MLFCSEVTYKALDKAITYDKFKEVLESISEDPKITGIFADNFGNYARTTKNKIFAYADRGKGTFRIEVMPKVDQDISLYHIECGGFDNKQIEFVVVDYAAAIITPEHFDNKRLFLAYAKKLFQYFCVFFSDEDCKRLKEDYETIGVT